MDPDRWIRTDGSGQMDPDRWIQTNGSGLGTLYKTQLDCCLQESRLNPEQSPSEASIPLKRKHQENKHRKVTLQQVKKVYYYTRQNCKLL